MARFAPSTYKEILRRLAYRVVARSKLTDLEEGGVVWATLAALARELDELNFQMSNLRRLWDIDRATGEDLDARAADFPESVERADATKATGSVVFSRPGTTGTVAIPLGHRVRVPGGPEFETTSAGSITSGNTDSSAIPVQAVEAGEEGNVDPATITALDPIAGVTTVTNAANTTGGVDEETDAQFRARLKAYIRSLSRGTPDAIKYAVLSTAVDGYGRVTSADVVELPPPDLGYVEVYIDDGSGTTDRSDSLTATETVLASAAGGERRLQLDNVPVVPGTTFTLLVNAVAQVENTDFYLNRSTGQIVLSNASYPSGLTVADLVECSAYTWYEGLIAEAQKVVNGDPSDRANYPGYRAAGTIVSVLPPVVLVQSIACALAVEEGYDRTEVIAAVKAALIRYVNSLGVNGDVYLSELIAAAQSVPGVRDVAFTSPTGNTVVGDGELARTDDSNVTVS